jgi:hypothetical protein
MRSFNKAGSVSNIPDISLCSAFNKDTDSDDFFTDKYQLVFEINIFLQQFPAKKPHFYVRSRT